MSKYLTAIVASLVVMSFPGAGAQLHPGLVFPRARPAVVRLAVILTTESPAADLTLDPGTIVNASADGGSDARVRADGNHVSLTHDGGGRTDARVRLLVSGIQPGARVRWHLTTSAAAPTRLEVYNENQAGRVQLVDRFDASGRDATFDSLADPLLAGGPVPIAAGPRPLVLSFFYPWAQHWNWSTDRLLDRPLFQYSTDLPDEVAQSLGEARTAGLDGVIVSWRGDTDWNDRRLRIVLDQAQQRGLRVSILLETLWATAPGRVLTGEVLPERMQQWLEKAFDVFAAHPAFLHIDGRPVVFVYVADVFAAETWRAIIGSLERGGRRTFLMADSLDPALLDSFNGAFTYATASVPRRDLERFYADYALRTQSYDLLLGGARRVYGATVTPGYDDSLLGRETTLVVDRANGAQYDAQWQAAVAARPDWMLITSWNEFWENTHIEPSTRYGRRYQSRTRTWSDLFRRP